MDMDKDRAEKFGKWLTRKFLDLQSQSGRMWTISEFAKWLGCPQQSVSRWMAGGSLPDSARAIYKLRDKFGAEVNTVLGIENGNGSIEPRIYAKFTAGWNKLPPDLQREAEDFFSSIAPDELPDIIRDIIRIRRERDMKHTADDSDEPGHDEESQKSRKGQEKKKSMLRSGAEKT